MTFSRYLKNPVIALPLAALAAFALYAPEEWVSSATWLSVPFNVMSSIFQPITAYTRNSAFPSITQAYMTFSFALVPLHFWFAYKGLRMPTKEVWHANLWTIKSYGEFAKRVSLVLLMCCAVFVTLFLKTGYDFNLLPINSSRLALALVGWAFAGAIQAWILAWIYCNLLVFSQFLRSKSNG